MVLMVMMAKLDPQAHGDAGVARALEELRVNLGPTARMVCLALTALRVREASLCGRVL